MKDPQRNKKNVAFMLNMNEGESEGDQGEDGDEEARGSSGDEGSGGASTPVKKDANKDENDSERKNKLVFVNTTDDVELPKKKQSRQLSKDQRNH